MSWKCPACSTPIRHNALEPEPRTDVIYRCPACRLELVRDRHSDAMKLAPFATAYDKSPRRKKRTH